MMSLTLLLRRSAWPRIALAAAITAATPVPLALAQSASATPLQDEVRPASPGQAPASEVAGLATLPTVDAAQLPASTRKLKLGKLTNSPVLRLRTTEGRANVDFGIRGDEVVTQATLRLQYVYSPALIAAQSHIKVMLNEEVLATLPVIKEQAGKTVVQDVNLDGRFFSDFNRLSLVFVGHYTNECEDPLHSSLWADISGSSELQLTLRPLALKSDLSALPEPFFDKRSFERTTLPYVFAAQPSMQTLEAAAMTASWFGKLSAWRGARFPVALNQPAKGHVLAFATNAERPDFLAKLPPFTGPALSVVTNPADGYSRMLLVSGRDGNDLKQAARALVLGNAAASGSSVRVKATPQDKPRPAYDAPNWLRLDRPVKLGELVDNAQQLQVQGHVPDPIRINFRLAPDLFMWKSASAPVDLRFRYTQPIRSSESRLVLGLNEELVEAVNLRASGQSSELVRLYLPLAEGGLMAERKEMAIPPFKIQPRNQLQFGFSFTYHKEGACRDTQVENVRAMIDPDSTIDFSGYPHYAQLPNLSFFASAGYPFTKYADLDQTAVVLPPKPGAADIEVMLSLVGRLGEATGYPGTRLKVLDSRNPGALSNRDLLLIGSAPQQALLSEWAGKVPAVVLGEERRVSQPARAVSLLYNWLGFDTRPEPGVAVQAMLRGSGPLAAVLGFESPVSSGRSVVAVTATEPAQMLQVLDALEDDGLRGLFTGSVAFVQGKRVESMLVGQTYNVGSLPFWTSILHAINQRPILRLVLLLICGVVLVFVVWRLLKRALAWLSRMQG